MSPLALITSAQARAGNGWLCWPGFRPQRNQAVSGSVRSSGPAVVGGSITIRRFVAALGAAAPGAAAAGETAASAVARPRTRAAVAAPGLLMWYPHGWKD